MPIPEIIEQEIENPFGIHVNKEKLVKIGSGSGVTLDDDIAENILNVNDVGKGRKNKQNIFKSFYKIPKLFCSRKTNVF